MLASFLTFISPFLVSGLTQFGKWLFPYLLRVGNGWLVTIVVVLSYVVAIIQAGLSGQPIDPVSIQALADTITNLIGATGVYLLSKKMKS